MEPFVAGENITLALRVHRYGNGSEYPAFLDISLNIEEIVTWAYNFIPDYDSYMDLISSSRSSNFGPFWGRPERMLSIKSDQALAADRKASEFSGGTITSFNGRWPVQEGSVRYDFEDVYEVVGDKEWYELEVQLPM